ncbi:Serine acetyltransferase [Lysobacter sp. A03]|nr:Serine acetyltransferase [Lysobacter sp. A03]
MMAWIQGYDHLKYWRRRASVVDRDSAASLLRKLWYLYYIKKVDARHGCSFGTNLNGGASFDSPPLLPHGPAGIFVGHNVKIGRGVTIFQQVTISHGGGI